VPVLSAVDMSETDRHLYDANSRYEALGAVLSDRHSALLSTERAVTQYSDALASLSAWLDDKEQIMLPLKSLSANEREAADKLSEHQVIYLLIYFIYLLKCSYNKCTYMIVQRS